MSEPALVHGPTADEEAGWPWPRATRSLGIALLIGGLTAVIGAYLGAAGAVSLRDGLAFVATGGIGGIAAVGLGAALLVVADLASSQRRIHALAVPIVHLYDGDRHDGAASPAGRASDGTLRRKAATAMRSGAPS